MRLTSRSSTEERCVLELQLWTISRGGVWLIDVEPYTACRVAGVVQRLRLEPTIGFVEATILDGTGVLAARWHLGRPTPQLAAVPGTGLVLEGVPLPEGERLIMHEPSYELAPFPHVA